jgi:uncharacterized membrane protein YphA (DoxX/SURF4 family)
VNYLLIVCVLISSLSFLAYSISYFISPHIKNEFKRFKLERLGLLTIILEILGAVGLFVGLFFKPILFISSGGLALLMVFALLVRIRSKDSLRVSLPAIFFIALNSYIIYLASTL